MTSSTPIRVGIIGANPKFGWAFRAHVPAIQHLPELTISAVSTTREASALAAAGLVGAAHHYTDAASLAADPDVDLVVVAVKVPHHVELVEAAIAAGKHVYCEWPLTQTTKEAEHLAGLAERAEVQAFVGLQTRTDHVLAAARDLIASGQIGAITSVTARSSAAKGADGTIDAERLYTIDGSRRAGDIEVQGGHLIDAIDHLLDGTGGIRVVDGTTALTRETYRLQGTDEQHTATAPDVFRAGVEVGEHGIGSIQAWYGDPDPSTEITVLGTAGKVTLRSERVSPAYAQQPQMAPFEAQVVTAEGRREVRGPFGRLPAESQNVMATYRQVVADLRDGGHRAPRFTDAVRLHRALDVVRSGETARVA